MVRIKPLPRKRERRHGREIRRDGGRLLRGVALRAPLCGALRRARAGARFLNEANWPCSLFQQPRGADYVETITHVIACRARRPGEPSGLKAPDEAEQLSIQKD